jgi:hypothetical protein
MAITSFDLSSRQTETQDTIYKQSTRAFSLQNYNEIEPDDSPPQLQPTSLSFSPLSAHHLPGSLSASGAQNVTSPRSQAETLATTSAKPSGASCRPTQSCGINEDSRAIELKRIVVSTPERGLGRSMLKELLRIDPGALENLYPENTFKGSVIKKDEGTAHPIQARSSLLQSRPNTFAQANSVITLFACKTAADHTFRVGGNTSPSRPPTHLSYEGF